MATPAAVNPSGKSSVLCAREDECVNVNGERRTGGPQAAGTVRSRFHSRTPSSRGQTEQFWTEPGPPWCRTEQEVYFICWSLSPPPRMTVIQNRTCDCCISQQDTSGCVCACVCWTESRVCRFNELVQNHLHTHQNHRVLK